MATGILFLPQVKFSIFLSNHFSFFLYSIQGKTPDYDASAMVEVQNTGMVRLFVPITTRALCPINGKKLIQMNL
jgi:hypothetical protein